MFTPAKEKLGGFLFCFVQFSSLLDLLLLVER
jgi:hypothetical protein